RCSRWLRPVMATASVVALGAASVVVGSFFASAPATEQGTARAFAEFPVLQPVAYGDGWPPDSDETPLSAEQGSRRIAVDAEGVPDPGAGVRDAAEVLSASPDPVVDDWGIDPVDGTDDPCAP